MRNRILILAVLAAGGVLGPTATAGALVSVGISDVVDGRRIAVPVTLLPNNYTVSGLSGRVGSRRYFRITIPPGQAYLTIVAEGGWGEADLYVGYRHVPSPTDHHFASTETGNAEQITIVNPAPGNWLILVHGYDAYEGLSLLASAWRQQVPVAAVRPPVSTRVRLDCGPAGRRPLGGLIPFILHRIAGRDRFGHHPWTAPRGGHHGPRVVVPPHHGRPRPPVVVPPHGRGDPHGGYRPGYPGRSSIPPGRHHGRTPTGGSLPGRATRPTPGRVATVPAPRVPAPRVVLPRTTTPRPPAGRTRTTPRVSPRSTPTGGPSATARPTGRPTAPSTAPAGSIRSRLLSILRDRIGHRDR